ncbi:AraC family transcriptional regulator [uncultured Bacteroides sp.]|uniref:helix-turn-helix domain-containing protein n=1 Tax=uncultured Bacteroides sp. TaxID=162156 RepID=UPI002AA67A6E|nr:AraC family transcriptional regulator [uncultured Bacteroides sp.]
MFVENVLKRYGVSYLSVQLGKIEIRDQVTRNQYTQIQDALLKFGLDIITDKKKILIEKIKTSIIELIHNPDKQSKINFSAYLSCKLKYNYTYLSNVFSENEGITIEHFIIRHKIERVKELILYNELNISEIANKLHYSSTAHLSNQFKKETGITPTFFKGLKEKELKKPADI